MDRVLISNGRDSSGHPGFQRLQLPPKFLDRSPVPDLEYNISHAPPNHHEQSGNHQRQTDREIVEYNQCHFLRQLERDQSMLLRGTKLPLRM